MRNTGFTSLGLRCRLGDELHHCRIIAVKQTQSHCTKHLAFGCYVVRHVAVPIKVVLTDIHNGRGIWLQAGARIELKAGQFQHPHLWPPVVV